MCVCEWGGLRGVCVSGVVVRCVCVCVYRMVVRVCVCVSGIVVRVCVSGIVVRVCVCVSGVV